VRKAAIGIKLLGAICLVAVVSIALLGCSSTEAPGNTANTITPAATNTEPTSTSINGTNASISAVPSVPTVKAGERFDVSIMVKNDQPARGVQFAIRWDPAKVECISAEQGSYFLSFAEAHNGSLFILPSDTPAIDNNNGKFPKDGSSPTNIMIAMTGAQGPNSTFYGVTGSGSVFILHMTAKDGSSGTVEFNLSNTILGDNSYDTNDMHPMVDNGKITITS